jgi:Flp pilus assembly protein TadD
MSETLFDRTNRLMKQNQWELVIEELNEKTLRNSNDWKLFWNAGWSLYKLKNIDKAIERFEQSVELAFDQSDKALCLSFLGISLLENENLIEARDTLTRALELKDGNWARTTLPIVLMELGEFDSAEQVHLEGLMNKPKNRKRLEAYRDYLHDCNRLDDAARITKKIEENEN